MAAYQIFKERRLFPMKKVKLNGNHLVLKIPLKTTSINYKSILDVEISKNWLHSKLIITHLRGKTIISGFYKHDVEKMFNILTRATSTTRDVALLNKQVLAGNLSPHHHLRA